MIRVQKLPIIREGAENHEPRWHDVFDWRRNSRLGLRQFQAWRTQMVERVMDRDQANVASLTFTPRPGTRTKNNDSMQTP